MVRLIIYIVILLNSFLISQLNAQTDQYKNGMEKAFQTWEDNKPTEASNLFERISKAEKDNWIPNYYVAYINIIYSFNEKDKEKLQFKLDKAKTYLEIAHQISPNNPEIMVLEAMMNTAWIAYDGQTYGVTLAPKNTAIYQKAIKIAPKNPRVILSKAEWDMGSARFFGQDVTPFCKDVEASLELFTNFKEETPFYPKWGEERAKEVIENCKS